ncbi:MAG: hypothetical protein CM15mP124_6830 [Alphaproteobacteria bacterium]|nr:MAG: hypothetical protein CM15mP124_6830 [Alphaproteobacteria bacterium]
MGPTKLKTQNSAMGVVGYSAKMNEDERGLLKS